MDSGPSRPRVEHALRFDIPLALRTRATGLEWSRGGWQVARAALMVRGFTPHRSLVVQTHTDWGPAEGALQEIKLQLQWMPRGARREVAICPI